MLPDISPITADDPGSGCTLCYEPDNDEVRSPPPPLMPPVRSCQCRPIQQMVACDECGFWQHTVRTHAAACTTMSLTLLGNSGVSGQVGPNVHSCGRSWRYLLLLLQRLAVSKSRVWLRPNCRRRKFARIRVRLNCPKLKLPRIGRAGRCSEYLINRDDRASISLRRRVPNFETCDFLFGGRDCSSPFPAIFVVVVVCHFACSGPAARQEAGTSTWRLLLIPTLTLF